MTDQIWLLFEGLGSMFFSKSSKFICLPFGPRSPFKKNLLMVNFWPTFGKFYSNIWSRGAIFLIIDHGEWSSGPRIRVQIALTKLEWSQSRVHLAICTLFRFNFFSGEYIFLNITEHVRLNPILYRQLFYYSILSWFVQLCPHQCPFDDKRDTCVIRIDSITRVIGRMCDLWFDWTMYEATILRFTFCCCKYLIKLRILPSMH